ncbi:AmmeMemoRadiSam system protein B [bacterium]|nr:AmmeMemoRadiSam system protein B [bacterium]
MSGNPAPACGRTHEMRRIRRAGPVQRPVYCELIQIKRQMKNALGKPLAIGLLLSLVIVPSLNAQFRDTGIRQPVVAGQFYPDRPEELRRQVRALMEQAERVDDGAAVMGLIVPHAGYIYSGAMAARGYRQVQGEDYQVVLVLSPSHRDTFTGATIYPGEAYQSPLGPVAIDRNLAAQIVRQCPGIQFSQLGHREEHSLEVQLPFIQVALPEVPIVPIMVGSYDWPMLQKMADGLAAVLKSRRALLIASSDLYHGYSYEACEKANTATIQAIQAMKPQTLCEGFLSDRYQACGGGPISLMTTVLVKLGATKAVLLGRTNSNDVTGQRGGYVVGYAAMAVKGGKRTMKNPHKIEYPPLDAAAQKQLIKMAREAIAYYLQHRSIPKTEPSLEVLKEKRGVFVTLTEGGTLRGCIGYHESDRPLYELVPDRAIAAAFEDPRFPPLRSHELDKIKIKVSVYLTNVYRIASLDEFQMGVHGIIMMKNGRGATYLPEVPLEAGWKTVEEEMESLCHKAGLPSDAWKQGAEFYVYKTQVFGEK